MLESHNSNQAKINLTSGPEQSIDYAIRRTIEAENCARNIYLQLSQMFAHVPDVSRFWQDLANDEAEHAGVLEQIQSSMLTEQLIAPADRRLLNSIAETISLLNKVSLETIDTLDNAYEIAHELESSEVNFVFKCLASDFITNEDRKQIVFLEVEKHQQKLMDFNENFGDRAWRKQIFVQPLASASSNQ